MRSKLLLLIASACLILSTSTSFAMELELAHEAEYSNANINFYFYEIDKTFSGQVRTALEFASVTNSTKEKLITACKVAPDLAVIAQRNLGEIERQYGLNQGANRTLHYFADQAYLMSCQEQFKLTPNLISSNYYKLLLTRRWDSALRRTIYEIFIRPTGQAVWTRSQED